MIRFYSPSNFKKSRLIARRFRIFDLILLTAGWAFSIISNLFYLTGDFHIHPAVFFLLLVPLVASTFLVVPYSIYHNIMEYIVLKIRIMKEPKKYIWEGIYKYEEKIES